METTMHGPYRGIGPAALSTFVGLLLLTSVFIVSGFGAVHGHSSHVDAVSLAKPGGIGAMRIALTSQSPLTHPTRVSSPNPAPASPSISRPWLPSTIPVGLFPVAVAYDPVDREIYVSDAGSLNGTNNISIVNTTVDRVVATIEVPYGVSTLAVSASGYVYFGDYYSTVYAISPYTNQIVSAIPLGAGCPYGCAPQPVAYDSQNGDIYVVDISSDNVSVIHNTSLVASIPVGLYPNGGVYDPSNGNVFVENEGSNGSGSITIINGSTNRVAGSTPLPNPGPGLAYDPSNGDIYVCENHANYGNRVSVVSGTTGQIVDTIPVGPSCNSEVFDPANGFIYVPDNFQLLPGQSENATLDYQKNVTVIDTRTNAVVSLLPVQRGPWGIAYDPVNQRIYVADAFTNNLSVLPPIYNLTFQAGSWLPASATWSLTLANLTLWSTSSSVRFAEPSGTYAYTLHVMGYPSLNTTGLVTVNVSDVSITLTQPGGSTYPVTFSEVGLPVGEAWSLMLAGSSQGATTGSIVFTEPNGTYAYSIADVPGWHQTTLPYSGSITVAGSTVIEPTLEFVQVPYTVTFEETGLPTGTQWSMTLGPSGSTYGNYGVTENSTTSSIIFSGVANGTYDFQGGSEPGYIADPFSGTQSVDGGPTTVAITFTVATYPITFIETGLPSGTAWWVNLTHGESFRSTTGEILFAEPNGTYAYTIADLPGWHQTTLPYAGSVTVNGAMVDIRVTWTPVTYAITFTERSLPSGAIWYVNLTSGPSYSSTTGTITFSEPNGSYTYTVGTMGNHVATSPNGALTVAGTPVSESPTFAQTFGITFDRPSGTSAGASWTVYVNTTVPTASGAGVAPQHGIVRTTTESTLTVFLPNGTYDYSIVLPGDSSLTTQGTVTMDGSPIVANPSASSSTFLGFSGLTGYYVLAAVAAAAIVVGTVIGLMRHRRPPAAPPDTKR